MSDKTDPNTSYHDFNPLNQVCVDIPDPAYDGDTIGPTPENAPPPDSEPHVDPRRSDGEDPMEGEPPYYDPRDPNGVLDGEDGP